MIKSIVVVASNYPSRKEIGRGAFVENFAKGLANSAVSTEVIAPLKLHKTSWKPSESAFPVHRPSYLSLSNRGPGPVRRAALWMGKTTFRLAVARGIHSLKVRPDAFYAHFLESGAAVLAAAPRGIPIFVGVGESQLRLFASKLPGSDLEALASRVAGFICVSEQLRDELVPLLGLSTDKVLVEPNGVDSQLFRPRPRDEMRNRLSLPLDRPIISIIGSFNERKGQNRVLEALEDRQDVRFVLIGKGSDLRHDDRILFKGCVPPEKVAEYLAASDLFVLPTQAEGSCNAVLEASATALPVVSSNLPTIESQFPFGGCLLVDPNDLTAIRNSVVQIIDDSALRGRLSAAALRSSQEFGIERRVQRMVQWMETRCSK